MHNLFLTTFKRIRSSIKALSTVCILTSCTLSGCAGTYQHTIDLDPAEPMRVAILPFAYLDSDGKIMDLDGELAIDQVALVSSELGERPTQLVRNAVQRELSRTAFDLIPYPVIEGAIVHNGLSKGLAPDLEKIYNIKPSELSELLDADAILYGKITAWDRSYYGLQTINRVGIELKLINPRTGKELFSAKAEDTDNRGLSKGPTGWTSLAIEPIKGLDNDVISALTARVVKKMIEPITVPKRPAVIETSPPSIFASATDAKNGVIKPGEPLTVLMFGSPENTAVFSIGTTVENVPMIEIDKGHFIGEYYPLPGEKFENEQVVVYLKDRYNRSAQQKVGVEPVSLR